MLKQKQGTFVVAKMNKQVIIAYIGIVLGVYLLMDAIGKARSSSNPAYVLLLIIAGFSVGSTSAVALRYLRSKQAADRSSPELSSDIRAVIRQEQQRKKTLNQHKEEE